MNNINTSAYKNIIRNFNIVIGISFILIVSIIYITYIMNIDIVQLNSNTNLEELENILSLKFIYYIKIFFSFLIPLSFFIFSFLFVLNPIDVKSILISFILIFLMAFYLYKLPYDLLINPLKDLNSSIKLLVHIISANLIILFIVGMSYIRYDIKRLYNLSVFYTMISEIIIWSFLIFFIISLIVSSIFVLLYLNNSIEIKRAINFFIRNNFKNFKLFLSVFSVFIISSIYFSYILYNKMINTKLSISVSRTLSLLISVLSIFFIILTFKYNLLNNQYIKFIFLLYFLFMIYFIFNMFLFRIDIGVNNIENIIYLISNISGLIFSIFLLYIDIIKFFHYYIIVFHIVIICNFIYNIFIYLSIRYRQLMFLYNYIYIICFIVLLFC